MGQMKPAQKPIIVRYKKLGKIAKALKDFHGEE